MNWQDKMRNAGSFRLSRDTAAAFALAVLLFNVALFCLLGFEYYLRTPDLLGFYLLEAMAAMLGPFIIYGVCDIHVMELYRTTGREIRERFLMQLLMDNERREEIRRSLRFHPLLLWFLPPRQRSLHGSARGIALWYEAFIFPVGSPALQSLRYPLMYGLGSLLTLCGLFIAGGSMLVLADYPSRALILGGMAVLGSGSLLLGTALLRYTAVALAIGDFLEVERRREPQPQLAAD